MTLYRFSRSLIEAYATSRRPGYVAAVFAADAGDDPETVALTREDYQRLADEYALCGPGCQLARTFAWFGLRDDGSCGCAEYAAQMDAWGPAECWRRLEEIVEHLREVAEKRGIPFLATAARIAVSRAIAAAEEEAAQAHGGAGNG